jgi:hypothetical protein
MRSPPNGGRPGAATPRATNTPYLAGYPTDTAIIGDGRGRRRARVIVRQAAIELVSLHYGAVPAAEWCTFCRGECRVVVA